MSMSAKLSLMSLSRVIASVGIAAVMEPSVQPSYEWSAAGFFDHWTLATWVVTLSFTSKSLITLYLLKSLDGIQKNVGEALAVIVIFLGQIAAGSSVFNLCAFLLACLVVILVRIYGLAGKVTLLEQQHVWLGAPLLRRGLEGLHLAKGRILRVCLQSALVSSRKHASFSARLP
ncbi:unnamed protein product [Durusdinium trenchii]|uniref:Uncharacterized protein n=1 Tax=Durusdinium trenchii TaxID=1381693 RepID=A0ABP0IND0_9DINO